TADPPLAPRPRLPMRGSVHASPSSLGHEPARKPRPPCRGFLPVVFLRFRARPSVPDVPAPHTQLIGSAEFHSQGWASPTAKELAPSGAQLLDWHRRSDLSRQARRCGVHPPNREAALVTGLSIVGQARSKWPWRRPPSPATPTPPSRPRGADQKPARVLAAQ